MCLMINNSFRLNHQELKDLDVLMSVCKQADGGTPNLYTHILRQQRSVPASLLYYERQRLVGFLSIYFFYEHAVEVGLLVHPESRRKGVAKKLLSDILPLVTFQNCAELIFSSPTRLNDDWLKAKGLQYVHSEYYMERDDLNPLLDITKPLHYEAATPKDIPILCALDEACFPTKQTNLVDRFQHLMSDREYEIILAYQNNHPVGKAHLRWGEHGVTLSDIAILPAQQGKGLGTSLITHAINYALSEGKPHVNLDVETHNKIALNLYTRLGFEVKNACDYWSVKTSSISG